VAQQVRGRRDRDVRRGALEGEEAAGLRRMGRHPRGARAPGEGGASLSAAAAASAARASTAGAALPRAPAAAAVGDNGA